MSAHPLDDLVEQTIANINRVNHLHEVHSNTPASFHGGKNHDDLLRAAVVFLHATLEEFLRGLARRAWLTTVNGKLISDAKEIFAGIPLLGKRPRETKLTLGDLVRHREKNVGELLQESAEAFLERATFNNKSDIKTLLEGVGIDTSGRYEPILEQVNEMNLRRHSIVHQVDRGKGGHPKPIDAKDVEEWAVAVGHLVNFAHADIWPSQRGELPS